MYRRKSSTGGSSLAIAQNVRSWLLARGGVHPESHKETASMMIFPGPNPEQVVIPLVQHVGAPCVPTVEVHDQVLVGQKIGDSEEYISAPVHSSVSGEVTGIVNYPHPGGHDVLAIQILSDGRNTVSPDVRPKGDPLSMTPEQIRKVVREGGIVGLGGGVFPTHVKLSPSAGKPINTVIINGAECEPYLTGDHRLMIERSSDIIGGALIIKRAVGAAEIAIAIERNKPDAIQRMREAGADAGVEVVVLPSRYPMGAEKVLIYAVTGREVPSRGLPRDVGVEVNNVATASAISDLFTKGVPLIERVLTVSGDGVAGHANLRVKIGTLARDVIEFCGGMVGERGKLIMGGPMMGLAQYTTNVPVIKGTSAIIVLRHETLFRQEPSQFTCIRCGRCVRDCPMNLMPYAMGAYADAGMWDQLDDLNITDCIECGSCAYICPTKNPLVQLIKVGKEGVNRRKKKMEDLEKAAAAKE
jgi:electron transport complex protein RnfC